MTQVEWNGDQFMADLIAATQDGLEAVGITMANEYSTVLNRQSSNKSNGGSPSQPGQAPARDTGTLARSIAYKVGKGSVRVGVASGSPAEKYATVLEYGSRGPIKPKNGKLLSWVDKRTGERRFAKQVHIHARPWLRPTLRKSSRKISDTFNRTVKTQMREWLN